MAEVLTGKPTPSLTARRKRREEGTNGLFRRAYRLLRKAATRRAFSRAKDILHRTIQPALLSQPPAEAKAPAPVRCVMLENLYAPRPYDPEQERAYAEQVLREQMEEWSREDEQEEPDESFHYAHVAGFDPQP